MDTEDPSEQVDRIEWDTQACRGGRWLAVASIWLAAPEYGAMDVWTVTAYGQTEEEAKSNCEAKAVAMIMRIHDDDFWNDSNERAFRNLFRAARNMQ